MKIGLTVASATAPPNAFAVFRDDLCRCVERCSDLGFQGIELALLDPGEVKIKEMQRRLAASKMEIPCLSTGQVFAVDGLHFTHPGLEIRNAAVARMIGMVRLAAEFGARVNIGRVRGPVYAGKTLETAKRRFLDCLHRVADVAEPLGVELIVEPVNRYEINFINNCSEGLAIVKESGRNCVKLMPDLFHMNIEDASFHKAFEQGGQSISYVHVADSNRWAPGWGHMDFAEIFQILESIGYDGYLTAEVLPLPDAESAARQTAEFLLKRVSPCAAK